MLKRINPICVLSIAFLWTNNPVAGQTAADTAVARALFRESVGLTDKDQFRTAKERLWEATRILEAAGATESALYATVLHQRGVVFIKTIRPDSAIILNRAALAIREKLFGYNSEPVSRSLLNIGQAYYGKLDFKKVLEYTQLALDVAKTLPPGNEEAVAGAFNNMSNAYVQMSNLPTAVLYADSALGIRLISRPVDSVNLAISYNNMGNLHHFAGDHARAVFCLEQSLALRAAVYGKWHTDVAATYCNLGAAVHFTGDNERALDLLQTALEIRQQVPPADELEMAESYANLMLPLIPLGDYDRAIEYGRLALAICKKNGLRGAATMGITHLAWGSALVYKGALDEAIQQFESALGIFNLTRNAPSATEALNNLGTVYGQKRDFQNQKKLMHQALERKMTIRKDHPDLAIGYINLGLACQNLGELDSALLLLHQAEAHLLRTSGPAHPHFVTLHNTRALALAQQADYDGALAELERAKRANRYDRPGVFQQVVHIDNLLTTLTEAAEIWRSRTDTLLHPQHLENARTVFLEAFEGVKFLRSTPLDPGSKAAINNRVFPLHEALIATDLALFRKKQEDDYRREAFRFAESSKSFNLLMAVRNSGANQFANIPPKIVSQERALQASIGNLEKQRFTAEAQPQRDEILLDSIQNLLPAQKDEFRQLQQQIRDQYPDYYELKNKFEGETVGAAQALLSPTQTLLEYFTGDSAVYIFAVRRDTFVIKEVKRGPGFPLDSLVRQLRYGLTHAQLTDRDSKVLLKKTAAAYAAAATELYHQLVAPVAGMLTENVIIVPDGVLGYIPFDALLTQKPTDPERFHSHTYFGKEKKISYAYSATLLREMRDKKHKTPPSASLLALAPFFRGNADTLHEHTDELSESVGLRRDTLTALPASGQEVKTIAKMFNGKAVYGADAPKETLLREAGKYRILHLSTHGKANDKVGDYAYLAFSVPGDTTQFDKFYVRDIYNLALNADLVTLSACETGIGELKRGEGIISLARAFAYAGAKSIVTSLWVVNDDRTAELMRLFYQNLQKKGWDKDRALWQAKNDFIAKHKTDGGAHPYFWAGFVPVGDMGSFEF